MTYEPPRFGAPPVLPRLLASHLCDLDIVEFMGPPTAHVLGFAYESLTSHGWKKPGEHPPVADIAWTEAEAWHMYYALLLVHLQCKSQICWRELPHADQCARDGSWRINSRLFAF